MRKSGGATPLLHAMRIGKSHQEVAIVPEDQRLVHNTETANLLSETDRLSVHDLMLRWHYVHKLEHEGLEVRGSLPRLTTTC